MTGSLPPIVPRSVPALASAIHEPWQPIDVVAVNDSVVRLARFHGEFPWHHHDEDELFLCWDGEFVIQLEGGDEVKLVRGEIFVVRRGTRHRPVAAQPAYALLLERPETAAYGSQ